MVKPPAISIRRLMPHRRTGSDGSDDLDDTSADEQELRFRSSSFGRQSQTWLPQTKPSPPKGIRKVNTAPRASSPLPPLYISSSYNSGVNLNSDSDTFRASSRKAAAVLGLPPRGLPASAPRRPARPSNGHLGLDESIPPHARSSTQGKRAESPLPPQGQKEESPKQPRAKRSESPLPVFNMTDSRPASPRPSTGQNEANRTESPTPFVSLADTRMEQVTKPRQKERELPAPPPEKREEWSDNVMQLIQETDQAFKAVGSALAEAKLASYSFERSYSPTPSPATATPAKELPPLPRLSLDEGECEPQRSRSMDLPIVVEAPPHLTQNDSPRMSVQVINTPASQRKVSTPEPSPLAALTPNSSTPTPTKAQTPNSKNQTPAKSKTKRSKGWPARSQAMAARFGLSENVTEIITGQRFKKIEADEMLTPDQIKELKMQRDELKRLENERCKQERSSEDSERSASLDRSMGRSTESVHELPGQPDSTDSEYEEAYEEWFQKNKNEAGEVSPGSQFPPRKLLQIQTTPAEMPAGIVETTPELPSDPATEEMTVRRKMLENLMAEEDNNYIYLKSTPYTMTNPCFRHGKINLSKVEVNKVKMTVDDTMDWTAFQMAILGGAGDWMNGLYDDEDEAERELADDISGWFDTFKFESFGELIAANSRSARDSAQSISSDSSLSSMEADVNAPPPLTGESPTSFWQESAEMPLDTNKFLCRWSALPENRTKMAVHGRDKSLPTSPMMPLVVGGLGSDSVLDESLSGGAVGMRYNLGHDLGDFLRWEAEQMCGTAFYGAQRA